MGDYEKKVLVQTLKNFINNSKELLRVDMELELTSHTTKVVEIDSFKLCENSSLISIKGIISADIILTFNNKLLKYFVKTLLNEDVNCEDLELYRDSTVGELLNIIVGKSISNFPLKISNSVDITPPTIISHKSEVQRGSTQIYCNTIETEFGEFKVIYIPNSDIE